MTAPQAWVLIRERANKSLRRFVELRDIGRSFVRRHLPEESQYLFALTLAIGAVCGLVAVLFHLAIQAMEHLLIDRALHAEGSSWMFWTILSPTLGGAMAGAALAWLFPGARGSGIPQVKQAFAVEGGRVRFRDALGKFVIGTLQIGSGASLGREGPTVQICAGATSLLARAGSLSPGNLRRLTPVGVAAGIAAAFNAPIAAVTFTIEEIVGTLDQAILSGVVIAAALAAVIERGILGAHPVIQVDQVYGLDHPSSLVLYATLGIAAAIVSVIFTEGLLKVRLWFRGLRVVPVWMQPAVGGMVTGALAVVMLRFFGSSGVTGGGYETLGQALGGKLGLEVLMLLCAAKLIATVCSYSSGGAGGIFAPALFVGAMLGGTVGHLDVILLHHEHQQLGAFALVGMGAVFAGVIRAPITSVLIIFEMTGGYGLVLPLMLANMTAYILARRWRPTPIYEALLEQDGILLPHTTSHRAHPLEQLLVSEAMTTDLVVASIQDTVAVARARVKDHEFRHLPVRDGDRLVGVVSLARLDDPALDPESSIRVLLQSPQVVSADTPLLRAVVRINDIGVRQLMVVDPKLRSKLVGILTMSDAMRAHARVAVSKSSGQPSSGSSVRSEEPNAGAIMSSAIVVNGATRLAELMVHLGAGTPALIVARHDRYDVILAEQLRDLTADEHLAKMLIAADIGQPSPSVDVQTSLARVTRVLQHQVCEAAVILDSETHEPVGVVTKSSLGRALLDGFANGDW